MARDLLIPILTGAISGAVAATVSVVMLSDSPSEVRGTDGAEVAALQERVVVLQEENREQAQRLEALEGRPTGGITRVAADGPSRADFDALVAQVEALGGDAEFGLAAVTEPGLQAAVDQVLAQREEEERQEKQAAEQKKREARVKDQVAHWTHQLQMTSFQAEQMTTLMAARDQSLTDLKVAVGHGEIPRAEAGEVWNTIEQEFESGLTAALTPAQLETYQSQSSRKGG